MRVHQWLKNALLFVPLLAAYQIGNVASLITLSVAFFAFSLCASAVYITNDLFDLESDRQHPRKRLRPFASGSVPISYGIALIPALLLVSFGFALWVGEIFAAWLALYLTVTFAYSVFLKRLVLIDCLVLAMLYTLRIIAGAAAVSIDLSFWLLAFSIFMFSSLAFVKRYAELQVQEQSGNNHAHGRDYSVSDAPLIQILGIAAGYAAVVIMAFYVHGETATLLYRQPQLIWPSVPLLLFWVSWVWMVAHRGQMHDDPLVFAIKDKASLAVAALIAISFGVAKTGLGF